MNDIEKLNNMLSTKETKAYSITGRITTADGSFVCKMDNTQQFKEGVNHYVYLRSFTGWSNFPNLSDNNNKFYYNKQVFGKWFSNEITVPYGACNVIDYSTFINKELEKRGDPGEPIKLSVQKNSAKCTLHIKKGYDVDFKREGTWVKTLGFERKV